tara:strand:+ start:497 stop:892 length:396 start_codon:yes stop_codon:yes gene_type:complete
MFEDNRKICIDLLIEDGQTSYVVLEFEDDIEDAMEDNEYEIIYKTDSAGNALKWCMNQFGDDDELYIPDAINEILTLDAQQKLVDIHNLGEDDEIDWEDGITQMMLDKIIRAIEEEFAQEENGDDDDDTED